MSEYRRGIVPPQTVPLRLNCEAHPEEPRFGQVIEDHRPQQGKRRGESQLKTTQMSRGCGTDVLEAKRVKRDDGDDGIKGAREMTGFQMEMKIQRRSGRFGR